MKKIIFRFFLFATIFCVLSSWYIMAKQPFGRIYIRPEAFEYTQRVYENKMLTTLIVGIIVAGSIMLVLLGKEWYKKN